MLDITKQLYYNGNLPGQCQVASKAQRMAIILRCYPEIDAILTKVNEVMPEIDGMKHGTPLGRGILEDVISILRDHV